MSSPSRRVPVLTHEHAETRRRAIEKLGALEQRQQAFAVLLEVPAYVLGLPVELVGHAVQRAVAENA